MRLKLFLLAMLVACTFTVRADVTLVLDAPVQSGLRTNEILFTGTISNTDLSTSVFLNDLRFSFTGNATNYLSANSNVFFANVPGILLPGESYHDVIFGVAISPLIPAGIYDGSITLQGGTNIFAATNLAAANFQIQIPAATLAIARSGTNLFLFWLAYPAGSFLQTNSDLLTTNWLDFTNAPTLTNGQNQLLISPAADALFYRLKYLP